MTGSKSPTHLICPLTSRTLAAMRADMDAAFSSGADMVECRLDFLETLPAAAELRTLLHGVAQRVIVTCRPRRQGGLYDGPEPLRLDLLRQACSLGAMVDVEDDVPAGDRPAGAIILSHHDFTGPPNGLDELALRLDASPAQINKIAFKAWGPEDALRCFDLLRACRKPTFALAMGEAGVLSRVLARKFDAFGTFAALEPGRQSAPGQPTLEQFKGLYRWDCVSLRTAVYGVIGCPVGHSMSPAIHNAAFEAAGLDAVYVPLLIQPGPESFNRFMDALLDRPWMDFRGLSVTIPHKENALAYVGADHSDPLARAIGAVNTITIRPDGALRGDNTDYAAAVDALCHAMDMPRQGLAGRTVAVLGAGGAGRSIVAAMAHYGARVTIYNRTLDRAVALADEFSCSADELDRAAACDAEIIINCTPIGMHPHVDASPLERIPAAAHVVFDTIYNPIRTKLLAQADAAGCLTVSGLEMFVNQAVAQFEIWTGHPAPRDVMRSVVISRLGQH